MMDITPKHALADGFAIEFYLNGSHRREKVFQT